MVREKKHYLQMTNGEKRFINNKIKTITSYFFSKHSEKRMEQKYISKYRIKRVLTFHDIVEFNFHNNDARVLLREIDLVGNRKSVCVVVSLITGNIITAYKNDSTDKHPTIDWSQYDATIDIIEKTNQIIIRNNLKCSIK